MCEICTYASTTRYDPTRTTSLRNAFARQMQKRFNELIKVIYIAVVEQDCFGKKQGISALQMVPPGVRAFEFLRDPAKVEAFMRWLQLQVDRGILTVGEFAQIGAAVQSAWTNQYVLDSYKRGVQRAREEMRKAGLDVPTIEGTGGIMASLGMPMHLDRIGLLYSRVFSELTGITAQMDTVISQILAQGMIDGDGPALIAKKLRAAIDGTDMGTLGITDKLGRFIPAQRRAMMLARTETIRAFHLATIQEYRNWGLEGIVVKAEWTTAGDSRVCPKCLSLEGQVFTLDQIEPMIPLHPQCRCIALPYIIE